MARGRMINQRLCRSRKYANLKLDRSRVLYVLMYTQTDCEGRLYADPDELKIDCCPYIKKYTVRKIAEAIIELADSGLISLYEIDGEPYIEFVDFNENQVGLRKEREAPSKIPDKVRSKSGVTPLKYKVLSLILSKEVSKEEKIYYCFNSREWKNVIEKDKTQWEEAYPACNVDLELKKMGVWLDANPNKKKSNYKQFINNWLSKTQDKGGTKAGAKLGGPKGRTRVTQEWVKERENGRL